MIPILQLIQAVPGKLCHSIPGLIVVLFLASLLASTPAVGAEKEVSGETFSIDYRARPDAGLAAAHDFAILSREAEIDLEILRSNGTRALAYLSLAEVAETASDLAAVKDRGVKLSPIPGAGRGHPVDVRDEKWREYFLGTMAAEANGRGFDGFFIDTADSVPHVAGGDAGAEAELWESAAALIRKLREEFPKAEIILNRGFPIASKLVADGAVDGLLVESLLQTYDFGTGTYLAVPEEGTAWLLNQIRAVKETGAPVYVVDYLSPDSGEAEARATAAKIREFGFHPLVTTVELHGKTLAPLREILRRVLVVYGWEDELAAEKGPKFAADTSAAERFHMALEWFGYEVDYFHIGSKEIPQDAADRYAAVLFDVELKIPFERETEFVDWTLKLKEQGVKLLFTGAIPFERAAERRRLFLALDIGGSADSIRGLSGVEITESSEEMMGKEVPLRPIMADFLNLQAPLGAEIGVSLTAKHEAGGEFRYDPVFVADWGGAVFDPYVQFYVSSSISLLPFDPFVFLEKALGRATPFPAPDPTTRDGLRVFYTHIDGDGYAVPSGAGRGKICAEVILERILKRYPFPVTVSVIEADTRAHQEWLLEKDRPYYEALAREIFALPHVEAASHSYSHPYVWFQGDSDYDNLYEEPNLVLKPEVNYPEIDLRREIAGSIDYINRELLADGKKVEVMLWSGNCRPDAEALRICKELGVENMNGGYTVISRRQPGIAGVAPRCIPWEDDEGTELQIFASNQNEFVYTNDWRGPFFGGFAQVIETFEQTESPRRLKPANIYYHFYSAATLGAQRALERVHDWCLNQDLHSLTAGHFAKIKRDCYGVRIFSKGDAGFLITGGGQLRTFRIPEGAGSPSMAKSSGVTGWNEHEGQRYIHTDGGRRTLIALQDPAASQPPHLLLRSSPAEIDFHSLEADRAEFTVRDLRPANLRFGGLAPSSSYEVKAEGRAPVALTSDKDGFLEFEVPPDTRATLDPAG